MAKEIVKDCASLKPTRLQVYCNQAYLDGETTKYKTTLAIAFELLDSEGSRLAYLPEQHYKATLLDQESEATVAELKTAFDDNVVSAWNAAVSQFTGS